MDPLHTYAERYDNIAMTRDEHGVLEVVLHSDGGTLKWGEAVHRDLPHAFEDIANDPDNHVVIITGAGDFFCNRMERNGWTGVEDSARWERLFFEGRRIIERLLDIEVPVVAAVNGPAIVHSELVLLSDIVIASETATFQDNHVRFGLVPGDGGQVFWPLLLGMNRARYFLLTGQLLDAAEAHRLGVVNEVVPQSDVLIRARALAHDLAKLQPLLLRGSRLILTQKLKREMSELLGYGLALEARAELAALAPASQSWTLNPDQ
jgi:enoyl-CoA hydratase/carnithine racemase